MLERYAYVGVLVMTLVLLVIEGFYLYRWYEERYYVPNAASDVAANGSAASSSPEGVARRYSTAPGGTREPKNANPGKSASEAAFAHTATDENSRGDYTYLSDPAIDGDPDAVVLVSVSAGQEGAGRATYGHNIGVWYEPGAKKWAIFNQDRAAVPAGASFRVILPPASESLVHRAGSANTVGNVTYVDDPLTNGEPGIAPLVTQNWNPGGGAGVYNDHPVGIFYDDEEGKWAVYNRDGAPMPEGAAFNLTVSESE